MTLRTLNYGNYGIFLIMGNAGSCPSTVVGVWGVLESRKGPRERAFKLRSASWRTRCSLDKTFTSPI